MAVAEACADADVEVAAVGVAALAPFTGAGDDPVGVGLPCPAGADPFVPAAPVLDVAAAGPAVESPTVGRAQEVLGPAEGDGWTARAEGGDVRWLVAALGGSTWGPNASRAATSAALPTKRTPAIVCDLPPSPAVPVGRA